MLGGWSRRPQPVVKVPAIKTKREKPKREKQKNDPVKVKAARELRDRYMEAINLQQGALESHGKYDVSRLVEAVPVQLDQKLLAA